MRSGMTSWVAPPSESTPSMVMRGEPRPVILAPMAMSRRPTSSISGSQAAHSMTVTPVASAAADITLAVPSAVLPLGPPKKMCPPRRRPPLSAGALAVM